MVNCSTNANEYLFVGPTQDPRCAEIVPSFSAVRYNILQMRRPQVLLKIKIYNSVILLDANGTSWMDNVTVFARKRQFITVLIRKFVNGGH